MFFIWQESMIRDEEDQPNTDASEKKNMKTQQLTTNFTISVKKKSKTRNYDLGLLINED